MTKTNSLPVSELAGRFFSDTERKEWFQAITKMYDGMRARTSNGAYLIKCDGMEFTILPDVYAPTGFFTDTLWYADRLKIIASQKKLLEIGAGTGVISVICAKSGARVTATDINPQAVICTRKNAQTHNAQVDVREGNVYDPLHSEEKYDVIFWNHPFNNSEMPVNDMLLRSGMDYRYEGLRGYLRDANQHLTPGGRLLLGTADSADVTSINVLAQANGYTVKVIDEGEAPFEEGSHLIVNYKLCEFIRANSSDFL